MPRKRFKFHVSGFKLHAFDDLNSEEVEAKADGTGSEVAKEKATITQIVRFGSEDGAVLEERGIRLGEIEEVTRQIVRHRFRFNLGEGFGEAEELEAQGAFR